MGRRAAGARGPRVHRGGRGVGVVTRDEMVVAMSDENITSPLLRGWRSHNRLAVLRLKVDVTGASRIPIRRAGQFVLGRWWNGDQPFAKGWMIQNIGFSCILNEPDVEVVERP